MFWRCYYCDYYRIGPPDDGLCPDCKRFVPPKNAAKRLEYEKRQLRIDIRELVDEMKRVARAAVEFETEKRSGVVEILHFRIRRNHRQAREMAHHLNIWRKEHQNDANDNLTREIENIISSIDPESLTAGFLKDMLKFSPSMKSKTTVELLGEE